MTGMEDGKLTTEQVANTLGLSIETVRRLIKSGAIVGRFKYNKPKLGYRIAREDLAVYLRNVGEEELASAVESGLLPEMAAAS